MQGAVNEEQYPELIETLLSGDIRTFRERLQSFIDQLPDNKRSANKKGFFPLFVLGGFLTLPDTKLGRDLGVKQVYYHIEKDKTGYVSGVKFAIPIEKQNDMKLLFIVVSDNVHIEFTPEEISYIKSKLGINYDKFSKIGYSIPIEHLSPTEYQSNIRIGEVKGISRRSFTPQKFVAHRADGLFSLKKRVRERNKDLEELISKCSLSDVKEVQGSIEKVLSYFDQVAQEYIIGKSGHFKLESDYHGVLTGFFVMLFKYRYNLKSYLELSLGEGFSDIVVLVRSTERSDNAIPMIIELKAGKTLTIQGTPFDQAGKYAEAFKYGPQRMITNNDNVIYAVYNPDLPNNRIKIDKAARDKQHPKPFLQSVLESADPAQIREQLKYTYYSIPNLAENYYRYTSEVLLGELIPVRTTKEVWNKYIFQHDRGVSNDITSFGFMNSGKNELVLLNIIRSDSRSKKINIDEVIGKNEEVNVNLGIHESIRGNRNLKIREVNLLLGTKKARAGEFKNWCRKVQVNSYDNLGNYNIKKTQSFSGEFAKLDINVNKLKNMLDNAVDKKGTGTQSDNAEHYKKLFTEVSSTVFPIKEMINNEIDFQAILHGLFMYYSDSQMSGGSKKRIGVIPEVQSGSGKRIDIGVIGGEEFTGIELKFSETQGIADGLTTKAKEAESQLDRYKKQPNNVKSLTDSERAKMFWAVFHKGASTPESLIETRDKFDVFQVVHSSMHVIPHLQPEDILEQSRDIFNQQCNGNRKKRNINMACVDSRDEEKITEEEKKQLIRELFNTDKVVEEVKNIEFYDQLFKVSQKISKGEIIDKNVEEAFVAKIKDIDLDSIDPEIRDIVKEMKDNIENKEEVKNILRRSGVAEKIGKVAEGAGLAFTAFLVGKHIANGDIGGLGYDALNLWVMPKIGEKISGKILELGTKLDSQMLKGFAPVMGRAIGNFAAFLGLAESIKARQNATDPAGIKIADLNIATNSIFIAADVPAIVTETMSAVGMEAGIIGEFAGPVGAAVSVAVIVISQFVEAGLEVEKLGEQIDLTDQEKHQFYWKFFLEQEIPDYIQDDIKAKAIYDKYISNILEQFKNNYDIIAMSLPSILVVEEEYSDKSYGRRRRHYEANEMILHPEQKLFEVLNGVGVAVPNSECRNEKKFITSRLNSKLMADIKYPFNTDSINHYSRLIPNAIGDYKMACGPLANEIRQEEIQLFIFDHIPNVSCRDKMKLDRRLLQWSLQGYPSECYNSVVYRNKNSRGYGSIYHMPFQNIKIDVVSDRKNASEKSNKIENRYYFRELLDRCRVYNPGSNFFYIAGKFSCELGVDGQKNIVITQGNLTTDSMNIHSIIGSNKANHIKVSYADYVDGKGGNDVITVKNFTTIKGYFGDSIYGKGLVLLPINPSDIGNITYANNITNIYNKSGAFISVDKQILVKTADGSFVTPTKVDTNTGRVTNLQITKLDDELDNLQKIDNSNFNITKHLSSANYHSTIGGSSNHIFYPDKEHHNFYWEAPSNISHLYLFDNRNANITIAQANGILDFSQLNCTLDDIPFTENDAREIKINKNGLHITLLPDYKDVTVTFDGQEYYKLQNGELERDYCSHSLRIDGRFSVNGTDLLNHHNCFTFDSDKVLFLKLNNNLLLLSDRGALSISNYYSSVHKNWDLSVGLNNRVMEPEEFGERADEFSSFRYYKPDEQGLQIYHNQPINKNDIGLVDLKGKSILDFDMKVMNDTLLLSHKNNTLVKLENWNTYQPAREMIFAFNDTIVSNSNCIVSICNSEDVIVEFNKEKLVLSTEELFDAVKQNNLDKVKELINQGANINAQEKGIYGKKPIHIAAENNNKNIIEFLLSRGVSVNNTERVGNTPLHYAAWGGRLEAAEFLVNKGANTDAADASTYGKKPVHVAAENNNKNIIEFLLNRGVSVDDTERVGNTPLHYAAWRGCLEAAEFLVNRRADINAADNSGKKPVHVAAENNNKNIIEFLLSKGVSVNEADKNGSTPLHYASWNGCLDVVEYLIGKGADISVKDKDSKTLFHIVVNKGDLSYAKLLVGKIESMSFEESLYTESDKLVKAVRQRERLRFLINEKDKLGYTPLQYAAKNGKWDIVNLFLDKTAERNQDDVADKDKFSTSWTTVHYAVYNGNMSLFNDIFQFQETMINTKDSSDWTPLHYAVYYNALDVVKFLVNKGADINAKDKDGKIPLDLATQENDTGIEEFLKQTQLDLDKQLLTAVQDCNLSKAEVLVGRGANINTKNDDGYTSLHFAVLKNFQSGIDYLIKKGTNIDAKDNIGRAPLHWAARDGYLNIVQAITEGGANLDVKDKDNKTPSDLASWKGYDNIVQYLKQVQLDKKLLAAAKGNDYHEVQILVSQGASLEAKDRNGRTSLYWASWNGNLDVVKYLIGKGSSINVKDKDGETPLGIAIERKYNDVVAYLQQILNEQLLVAVRGNDFNKVKDLVSKGASVDTKDSDGWTLLHHTARRGYLEVAEFLIEKGADINAEDKYGKKPIQRAAEDNNKNIITLLLSKGVNINDTDRNGRTSLYWATWNGNLDAVKYLVGKDASIQAGDKDGKTALDIARDKGYNDVVNYLEEELNKEREKPAQRKRRHHHGDHNSHHLSRKLRSIDSSNQPEIAASSGTRQSSWINGLFVWVKSSVNGLVSSVVNKISTKELENSKSGDTDACSAGLEKMYNATIPQSRKSLVVTKGNIPNRSWSSHQEKIRSNVTVAPEINTDVVNSVLILGDLAVRFMNGTSYQQPIHENLLSPREQSMRSIDEDMIIRAIQQGKEKFGVPDTNMDEVEIIGNKTEIGK